MDFGEEKKGLDTESQVTPAKGKNKKKILIKYALLFQGSMVIVFITVWFAVSRMESARRLEMEAAQGAASDSTAVARDSTAVSESSTECAMQDSMETLSDEERHQEEKMRLIEQMTLIKDQLVQKQIQMREMSMAAKERESLSQEIEVLKKQITDKEDELKYY